MLKLFHGFIFLVFLMGSGVSLAQTTETELQDPEPVIEIDQRSGPTDKAIQERIEGIFAELNGLETISVSVSEGVVTLGGEASSDANVEKALRLAIRPVGVVAVEDEVERTLDLEGNVTPVLREYKKKFDQFVKALPLITLALGIILAFTLLGGFISRRTKLWRRITPSPFLAEILAQAVRIFLIIVGVVLALDLIGASALLTTILGGAGVLGIAIGFAIRDTMENYISSVMLSIRQPFRAKDYVVINDKEGIVVRLTSRATILMTPDGNHLRIPNSDVFKGTILNYTTNPERRFAFKLGVDANDDPVDAMKIGLDALRAHDFVLEDPASGAFITDVGDSNIVIQFMGWVNQTETSFSKARSLAIRSVKRALEDNGFSLPEPIYRLRFDGDFPQASPGKAKPAPSSKDRPRANTETSEEEILDVKPDQDLQDKVEAEIRESGEGGLLDESQPKE